MATSDSAPVKFWTRSRLARTAAGLGRDGDEHAVAEVADRQLEEGDGGDHQAAQRKQPERAPDEEARPEPRARLPQLLPLEGEHQHEASVDEEDQDAPMPELRGLQEELADQP